MKLHCSEGKEKRVRNPETETVVSSLGPNLFNMYAGSFLVGNHSILILLCKKKVYSLSWFC